MDLKWSLIISLICQETTHSIWSMAATENEVLYNIVSALSIKVHNLPLINLFWWTEELNLEPNFMAFQVIWSLNYELHLIVLPKF